MARILIVGLLGVLLLGRAADAQNCPAYTYTLTNGTTADANQVMGNFNTILNCTNNSLAPLAAPHFTGFVGIGTTNPGAMLFAYGSGSGAAPATSGSTDATMNLRAGRGSVSIDVGIVDSGAGYIQNRVISNFSTNENLSLEPNGGYVGIGTLAPTYTLQVNGSAAGNTAWTTLSDARLKKNIQQITGALGLIERLRGVRYQWRTVGEREVGKTLTLPTDEPQIGFVAQEVVGVVPEAVVVPKVGSDGVYGVKDDKMLPILVEAVKEQQAEIEQLRATVAALKSGK